MPLKALLSSSVAGEFARYFTAGIIALAVDFSIYVALTEFARWHYLLSGGVAFCAGLGTVYFFSISWVFRSRRIRRRAQEFGIFVAIGIVGLALTTAILYALTDLVGLDYRLSKIVSAGLVFLFNFGSRKVFLFRELAHRGLASNSAKL